MAVRRRRQAVRLLRHAVNRFKASVRKCSDKPDADSSVVTFERHVRRLKELADEEGSDNLFWSLHQKVYLQLLRQTLRIRN
jgi:hypothetical protein